ncbi:hypothetical protein HKX48_006483 [Thoreauomyces humboldtii]|nr:hypothetical protein HKX48_006483 [Thoreauomyces humboldtii]
MAPLTTLLFALFALASIAVARPHHQVHNNHNSTLVTICAPPTEAELAGTWLSTSVGQSADVILKNTALVYNQLVLPEVHNCFHLDGNVSVALSTFYAIYSAAEIAIHATAANDTDIFAKAALRDTVCTAIETVQALVVSLTEARWSDTTEICKDDPPAPEATTQIVNYNCNLYPAYQPQDRPYFLPELDQIAHPKITYLAQGFGCRGNLVRRMEVRERDLVEGLARRG